MEPTGKGFASAVGLLRAGAWAQALTYGGYGAIEMSRVVAASLLGALRLLGVCVSQ